MITNGLLGDMITISVIIPVYNVEHYIERCLMSVMHQTYGGPIECIIVDDCGTDRSMAIVSEMLSSYNGLIAFRVIHHKINRGLSAARNTGTDCASGDYVYYLDGDDAMTEDCLSLMAAEVEKHPQVEMVLGAYNRISESIEVHQHEGCYVEDNRWIRYEFFKQGLGTLHVQAWNKLLSLSFLRKNSLHFLEGVIHEDEHWSFFVYKELKNLSIIEQVTYLHYVTPFSIMTNITEKITAESMCIILNDLKGSYKHPLRSLQVFKYLLAFLKEVYPFVAKSKSRPLWFGFLKELLLICQFKIAFYLFVNWFRRFRFYRLYSVMIPEKYQECMQKVLVNHNNH